MLDYRFTLIHYYDLNPIIMEINKLHLKAQNITNILTTHTEYLDDNAIHLQILGISQTRVENKIKEIVPQSQRIKRGLVNMLGSVFKAVTGNLDALDGERYDQIIKQIQSNQNQLAENAFKQNSISLQIISKFNKTVEQVGKHEKLLESKIKQISYIMQKTTFKENSIYIKNVLSEIINLYTYIDSLLQDVENSITFCKLKTIHPSIIKTEDLFLELKSLEKRVGTEQMPIKPELDNIHLYEDIIDIECFIHNNKITYLLHIPITRKEQFELYHLYSTPILKESRFKTILPRNKFLIKSKLHFAYQTQGCQKISSQQYFCNSKDLTEIDEKNCPCAVCLLSQIRECSGCQPIEIQIEEPIVNQLSNSHQWLIVSPKKQKVKLQCPTQIEALNLFGTYIVDIPRGCEFSINDQFIVTDEKTSNASMSILFPDFGELPNLMPSLKLDFKMNDLKLDGLQELRTQILSAKHSANRSFQKSFRLDHLNLWLSNVNNCIFLL